MELTLSLYYALTKYYSHSKPVKIKQLEKKKSQLNICNKSRQWQSMERQKNIKIKALLSTQLKEKGQVNLTLYLSELTQQTLTTI